MELVPARYNAAVISRLVKGRVRTCRQLTICNSNPSLTKPHTANSSFVRLLDLLFYPIQCRLPLGMLTSLVHHLVRLSSIISHIRNLLMQHFPIPTRNHLAYTSFSVLLKRLLVKHPLTYHLAHASLYVFEQLLRTTECATGVTDM